MITLFDTHFHYSGELAPVDFCAALPPEYRFMLMAVAGDYADSFRVRDFAEAVEDAYFACGVHPHEAEKFMPDQQDFSAFRLHHKFKAVGEIGLDFFYGFSGADIQLEVFNHFLELALAWDKPAIIHLRDKDGESACYSEAEKLLIPFAAKGGRFIIHCFSATPEWAEKFLSLGAYLGMTGMVTFKRSDNIRETLKAIPPERLLIETDSPYLAPVPFRGRPNHPAYLPVIAEYIAGLKGLTLEEFAHTVTENGKKVFSI